MALPNGTQVFIEGSRSAVEIVASAVSNALKQVVTTTDTDGLVVGDYVLCTESVWASYKNRVLRVSAVTEDASFTLEGDKDTDTTDTSRFPAGGAATFVKIESWLEIPCVNDIAKSGGEQQYYTKQCLADDREKQIPTFKSATSLDFTFDFDYANPITSKLVGYDRDGKVRAMHNLVPKASYPVRTYSGIPSFDNIPNTVMNEDETVNLTISLEAPYCHMQKVV
ncbi:MULTISPECIES: phage tail protein [Gammaproteobacteria]|uniref:phage tail protein n=1 Tax=Gammaproteobacteria TaxID=1236 RepID=UPI002FC7CAB2